MLDIVELEGLWVTATKTKPMRVKHISAVVADMEVTHALLVRTLEGDERVSKDAFICVGPAGEMWQQAPKALFKKYDLTAIDENGWWTATPKPGNAVDACKITEDLCIADESALPKEFSVEAQWGTESDNGKFYQSGKVGDWVLRSKETPSDVWIVRGDLFNATYEIRS